MTQALHSDREPVDTGAHHLTNLNHRRGLGFWASLYSGYAPAGATLNPADRRPVSEQFPTGPASLVVRLPRPLFDEVVRTAARCGSSPETVIRTLVAQRFPRPEGTR